MMIEELSPLQKSALIIKKLKTEIECLKQNKEDIAIVGMACRFPGGANTPDQFWDILKANQNTVQEISMDRFDIFKYYDSSPASKGKINTKYAHLINHPLNFDPSFFNISNRETESLDPQHRLLLEVSWEALENAGIDFNRLVDSQTGVFVGIGQIDYLQRQLDDLSNEEIDIYSNSGNSFSFAAGRLAYHLGVRGPCMAVDTACSSSLTALHLACNSLLLGESNQAIVAGVQLILSPKTMMGLSRLRALSPSGCCKAFSADADGFGRGEGCGVVILKRLSDAQKSQDNILAVIKATGVNHNGESSGLTVPNGLAQRDLIAHTLKQAQLEPNMIDYIEAHGTGTELGDPIEVDALTALFKNNDNKLKIGSVKSNIGHLEAAAGIAGLIKVILSLQHELLPKSIHTEQLNPHINWQDNNIEVVKDNQLWPKSERVRCAGVSSFGMNGTNTHAIISEHIQERTEAPLALESHHLLILSAKSKAALLQKVSDLLDYLTTNPRLYLTDFCFTNNCGRFPFNYRIATAFSDVATLTEYLRSVHSGIIKIANTNHQPDFIDKQQLQEQGLHIDQLTQRCSVTQRNNTLQCYQLLVELFLKGYTLELYPLYPNAQKCILPTYPFHHKPYWYMKDTTRTNTMNSVNTTLEQLKINLAKLLNAEPDDLNSNSSLLELGADSIVLVEAIEMIEKIFGIKLSVRQLFEEFNTLSALATYVAQNTSIKTQDSSIDEKPIIEQTKEVQSTEPLPQINTATAHVTTTPPIIETNTLTTGDTNAVQQVISQQLKLVEQLFTQQLAVFNQQPSKLTTLSTAAHNHNNKEKSAPTSRPWAAIQTQRRQLTTEQQLFLDSFLNAYSNKTAKSKQHMQQSRQVISDFRNSVGFRLETKNILYPIVTKKAAGSRIWDLDGNEYIDYCLGYGVHFFGHTPSFLNKALTDKIAEGYSIGPQSHLSLSAANLIKKMTGMTRVAFCNSGTHAVDTAIRIARAQSKKRKIITFTGSYHGHSDHTLAFSRKTANSYDSFPVASGICESLIQNVTVLPYAESTSLDYILQHADEIAAVLVEPVQSRQPDIQPKEFLKQLREVTQQSNVILIFDEIVNGFRIHQGGAQAWFDIQADIVTYGKLIASGLPIGIVAAREELLDCLDGGAWEYGDESYPKKETTFFGGTFNQNPLTMAATEAVLRYLDTQGPSLQERLNHKIESLVSRVNVFLNTYDFPLKIVNFGTMFRFTMPGNTSYLYQPIEMDLFYLGMIHHGIYIWEGRTCYISTAHTDEDMDYFVEAVQQTLINMRSNGFFPGKIPELAKTSASFPQSTINSHLKTIYGIHHQSTSNTTQQQKRFWERSQSKLAQLSKSVIENELSRSTSLKIGISFFGTYSNDYNQSKYDLVLSASKFADQHGFSAVWLPERHFHEFGGLSPNPSVLCSAISQVTNTIHLRAGSVVLPLHHPIRVAEDWSIIDNLSNGRTGIAFASGWHPDDFILAPNTYGQQRDVMLDAITVIQSLWQGGSVMVDGVKGTPIEVTLYPMPKQKELPTWLTVVNSKDMYQKAGQMGSGILTNLLGQNIEDLKNNIATYRESLQEHGYAPETGNVTILLHTFLDAKASLAVDTARKPFCNYLKSSVGLFKNLISSEKLNIDVDALTEEDKDFILNKAYDSYVNNSALIGSPQSVEHIINLLKDAGVDEIACFIDFGIDPDKVQKSLIYINELKGILDSRSVKQDSVAEKVQSYPLTREQRQIFALNAINPEACLAYNEACVLRFRGLLKPELLEQSIQYSISRHVALKTLINENGLTQHVLKNYAFSLTMEQAKDIPRQISAYRDLAFDLQQEIPLRALLLSVDANEHILVLVGNHILIDGWSMGIILKDISEHYSARYLNAPLPVDNELMGFDTFIQLRQESLLSEAMNIHKEFWLKQFMNGIPRTQLPTNYPVSNEFLSKASRKTIEFTHEELKLLNKVAGKEKSTLFMLLFAAYGYLLHFISQQSTIMIGIPVSGRNHKDDNILVGYCTYLLPIICHYEQGESFANYLSKVKNQLLDAFEHQAYSFGNLTEALTQQGFTNPSEMIKVIFNLDRPLNIKSLPNLEVQIESQDVHHKTFDLDFNILNLGDKLVLDCDYLNQCFTEGSIVSWLHYYQSIIQLILKQNKLNFSLNDILSKEEKNYLIHELFPNQNTPLEPSVNAAFVKQVKKNPEAIALISEQAKVSYRQLDERSNQLANYLQTMGVSQGMIVAVFLDGSIDLINTLLAIIKLGAAYLIVDTKDPVSRIANILEDSLAIMVISDSELADKLPLSNCNLLCLDEQTTMIEAQSKHYKLPLISAETMAYVCYTSGTTGKPKGVMVPHRGILRLTQDIEYVKIKPDDVFIQLAAVNFDATTFEIWACLLNGAKLVLPSAGLNSIAEMAALVQHYKVSILWLTAGLFQLFVQHHLDDLSTVQQLIAGGDVLPVEKVNQFIKKYPKASLINGYGPTETTTFACTYTISKTQQIKGTVPIGTPINNTKIYILGMNLDLVPKGSIGELYIAGDGLALGYLHDEQLSTERFILCPFTNQLMYKTGDLVRCNEQGFIEFVGRADNQIKINGFRIEAQDIEHAFNQWDKLNATKVMVVKEQNHKKLVLFYYDANQAVLTTAMLRKHAMGHLPSYAIPHHFVPVKTWPLTTNGKVDTNILLKEYSLFENECDYEEPTDQLEQSIALIWQQLFNTAKIGRYSDFFELGGDSITALQLSSLIKEKLGYTINPNHILRHPSICDLASYLSSGHQLQLTAKELHGELPLTPIQEWFFAKELDFPNFFLQSICLEITQSFNHHLFAKAISIIMRHYDAFRLRFTSVNKVWTQHYLSPEKHEQFIGQAFMIFNDAEKDNILKDFQSSFDIEKGQIFKVACFLDANQDAKYLVLSAHHLIIDSVSWRFIFKSVMIVYEQLIKNITPNIPSLSSSFKDWSLALAKFNAENKASTVSQASIHNPLPSDYRNNDNNLVKDEHQVVRLVSLASINQTMLLNAVFKAFHSIFKLEALTIDVEGHGRDCSLPEIDLTNTVGWFTTIQPLSVQFNDDLTIEAQIEAYLANNAQSLIVIPKNSAICFNYLGNIDQTLSSNVPFRLAKHLTVNERHDEQKRLYEIEITAQIIEEQLEISLSYPAKKFKAETISNLLNSIAAFLDRKDQTTAINPLLNTNLSHLVIPLNAVKNDEGSMIFIPGTGGNIIYFHKLVKQLEASLPCFGIQAIGLNDDLVPLNNIPDIAKAYIKAIKDADLKPPYHFFGHSLGAITVFEIITSLSKKEDIGQVVLLDMLAPTAKSKPPEFPDSKQEWMIYALRHMERYLQKPLQLETTTLNKANENGQYELFKQALISANAIPDHTNTLVVKKFVDVLINNTMAYKNYNPDCKTSQSIHLIKAYDIHDDDFRPEALLSMKDWGWKQFVANVNIHQMSVGDHLSMFASPAVDNLAKIIKRIIDVEVNYA